ncbi:MAG TPA: response regulator transcription factor [Chloroflexia bacterium]|nr:response regulator transcription factor [Chloroflexia bacterium]
MTLKIVIIDDHVLVGQALEALLSPDPQLEVVGRATNGREGLALVRMHSPDLVLLDWLMPDMDGLEVLKILRQESPDLCVLILSALPDVQAVQSALKAGAKGFLLKSIDAEELVLAIKNVAIGQFQSSLEVNDLLSSTGPTPKSSYNATEKSCPSSTTSRSALPLTTCLTERELEVMKLVVLGKTNKEIARQLGVSLSTVKSHTSVILRKLELESRTQLAIYAVQNNQFDQILGKKARIV